ncbi:MAG: DUF5808 domain-containing protein [bacterium]
MLLFSLTHLLLIALAGSLHPRWSRPDLLFAVTVPAGFRHTPPGRALLRRYRVLGWAGTLLLAVAVILSSNQPQTTFALAVAGGAAVWLAAFLLSRRATLPSAVAPDSLRTASLAAPPDDVPGGILALLAPLLILAARALECALRWDEIPARFPIHWGLHGPDRWTAKTPQAVYGQFAAFALLSAVMLFLAWATVHRGRAGHRSRRIGAAGLMALGWLFALAFPPLEGMALSLPYAPFLLLGVTAVWLIAMVRSGWGTAPGGHPTANEHWRLGLFSWNPDDPALILEKRFGLGWTLNFAHPARWAVLAAVAGGPLLLHFAVS